LASAEDGSEQTDPDSEISTVRSITPAPEGNSTAEVEKSPTCEICGITYKSYAGKRGHLRKAHGDSYHAAEVEKIKDSRNTLWSEQEAHILVLNEIQLCSQPKKPRYMNQALAAILTNRTVDSITGQRKKATHKNRVAEGLVELRNRADDQQQSDPVEREDAGDQHPPTVQPMEGAGDQDPPDPTPVFTPEQRPYKEEFRTIVRENMRYYEEIFDENEDLLVTSDKNKIDKFVESLLSSENATGLVQRKKNRGPRTTQPPPRNRTERKARELREVRQSYERKPNRCLRQIIKGGSSGTHDIRGEELREFWQGVFSNTPEAIPTAYESKPRQTYIAKPVTLKEVKQIVQKLEKETSPGPDGVTAEQIKKMKSESLRLLFIVFQITEYSPRSLREGVVTLIPKKENPTTPGEFRPITVTSVILRAFHGVLAKRMEKLPISSRQKAFLPRDGIAENLFILKETIDHAKHNRREQHIVFCDVAKAFDSVAHPSLVDAARRIGIPETVVRYIATLYREAVVKIKPWDELIDKNTGIQQGDPLSGPLFNAVVDFANDTMDPKLGYKLVNTHITHGLFADDEDLISENRLASQQQLDNLTSRMGGFGMRMNAKKCATLSILSDRKRKRYLIDKTPFAKIDGELVPALGPSDTYKYLGMCISAMTTDISGVKKTLQEGIQRISASPLKPQQRLRALKQHLIPATQHQLILGDVGKGFLITLDRINRAAVRRWLKLPHDTSIACIHARTVDGGLGVPSLQTNIPTIVRKRYMKLRMSNDPIIQDLLLSERSRKRIDRLIKPKKIGNHILHTIQDANEYWKLKLQTTVDGKWAGENKPSESSQKWLLTADTWMTGQEFVRSVKVRAGVMKTPSRAARGEGRGVNPKCSLDRQIANQNHILQTCDLVHGYRVRRHDKTVSRIRDALHRAKHQTVVEPRLKIGNTYAKPDILTWQNGVVHLLDPTIISDGLDLGVAHSQKVLKYQSEEIATSALEVARNLGAQVETVCVTGIAISNRGVMLDETFSKLVELGMPAGAILYMLTETLSESWKMVQSYNNSNKSFMRR
jgi:hypothetical protein